MPTDTPDQVIRVMTDDHGFRVIVADTTNTCRDIVERQKVRGPLANALAELVTATILMRETMAPNLRVQGIVKGADQKGSLVGDSFPDGATRGLSQLGTLGGDGSKFSLGKGALLQMMRTLHNGSIHQGIVDVGEAGGIGQALMVYLQESEQIVSVGAIGARSKDDSIVRSGGFIVQLLPEVERPAHMIMTARLEDFPSIDTLLDREDFSARGLLDELLYGMPFTELGDSNVRSDCQCSETSLLSALATLSQKEIESLIEEDKGLEITCDYCLTEYVIAVERLRALLSPS